MLKYYTREGSSKGRIGRAGELVAPRGQKKGPERLAPALLGNVRRRNVVRRDRGRRRAPDPAKLVDAFVATANASSSDTSEFACVERAAAALLKKRGARDRVRGFFAERRLAGFDAVHHSPKYREAYAPAYRVIARSFLEGLGLKLQ